MLQMQVSLSQMIPFTKDIHSYTSFIQVLYYSEALPNTALILCRSYILKRHRQLSEGLET